MKAPSHQVVHRVHIGTCSQQWSRILTERIICNSVTVYDHTLALLATEADHCAILTRKSSTGRMTLRTTAISIITNASMLELDVRTRGKS
jgi:hypothetical protein